MTTAAETTSLYIHVPFCLKKCPYCDFFSQPVTPVALAGYADLLITHLNILAAATENRPQLESVFFGGGTPSLLPPADVDRLLGEADRLFGLTAAAEISLEANPGTLSAETLAGFRAAGVNRLSIGVQSLCDRNLHLLGRQHNAAEAGQAIRAARQAGFANLSCDLMFALPGQSVAALRSDLQKILEFEPEHLALYGLTIEKGTDFSDRQQSGEIVLPDEEIYVEGYHLLSRKLAEAGFRHYEISNFARPGRECRHNQRYWHRLSNLGLGAGAHSFASDGWGARHAVADSLTGYVEELAAGRNPARLLERFDRAGAMAETLYLGLRTASGVDAGEFLQQFGTTVEEAYPEAVCKSADWLRCEDGFWRLNFEGWLLFDTLILPFLQPQ